MTVAPYRSLTPPRSLAETAGFLDLDAPHLDEAAQPIVAGDAQ